MSRKIIKWVILGIVAALVLLGVGASLVFNAKTYIEKRDQGLMIAGALRETAGIIQAIRQRGAVEVSVVVKDGPGKDAKDVTLSAVLTEKAAPPPTPVAAK